MSNCFFLRGRGLNEIGHSFPCKKSPVHIPTWRTRSSDFVRVEHKDKYKANEMRGPGLKMPDKAQVIIKSWRSYKSFSDEPLSASMHGYQEHIQGLAI